MRIAGLSALAVLAVSISVGAQVPAGTPTETRLQMIDYLNGVADSMLAKRAETVAKISTKAAAEARQAEVREKVLRLIGGLPDAEERGPLNAQIVGEWRGEGFRVERVIFESLPKFYVTANLYLPEGKGKFPAILETPGHGPDGKAGEYAFASNFARNGMAVLAVDPLGQGERLQYLDPATGKSLMERPTGEHSEASVQPMLIGDHVSRYFVNDGMRAIDYLLTRPEIDGQRIGAFGCSGGGTDTAYLTALDDRVKVAGVACYVGTFHELLRSKTGVQEAEQTIPHFISEGLDIPDWVEMAAPRKYAVISTTEDMFPFAGAKAAVEEVRGFYKSLGAEKNLTWITGPGGHGNLRPIFGQILDHFRDGLGVTSARVEPVFGEKPPVEALQCTTTGQVGNSFADVATVYSLNKARMEANAAARRGRVYKMKPLAMRVRELTGVEAVPSTAGAKADFYKGPEGTSWNKGTLVLHLQDGLDARAVFYRNMLPGRHGLTLYLSKGNFNMSAATEGDSDLLEVRPVPFPAGGEEQKAKALGEFYLLGLRAMLVGKTLAGLRIDSLIEALNWACQQADVDCSRVALNGVDRELDEVLLQAAVLDPRIKTVRLRDHAASYKSTVEQAVTTNAPENLVPGVVGSYDLPELESALGKRLLR